MATQEVSQLYSAPAGTRLGWFSPVLLSGLLLNYQLYSHTFNLFSKPSCLLPIHLIVCVHERTLLAVNVKTSALDSSARGHICGQATALCSASKDSFQTQVLACWNAPPPRTHVHTHTHERATHTHTQRTSLCFVQIPLQYQVFPKAIAISRKKQGDRHSFPWLVGWAGLLADAILDYAGRWPLTCLSSCVDICFHFKSCGPFLLKFIVFVLF